MDKATTNYRSEPNLANFAKDFGLAGLSSAVAKTLACPIERFPAYVHMTPGATVIGCYRRVLTEEGITAFWRGNITNVRRNAPAQAVNLAFKNHFQRWINRDIQRDGYLRWSAGNFGAGAAAGLCSLVVLHPLDFAQNKFANDVISGKKGGGRFYKDLPDVFRKTFAAEGVTGLYRGWLRFASTYPVYQGFLFGTYDSLKPLLLVGPLHDSLVASFFLGGA
eukprot:TRINITY_DN2558_c0_g1_i1.p1 TRINITY_DN2558_c0_g1~~TRINITY_DN2558_c0_g1_i1.p1  ORF type:complete len:221 (-),score=7.17 TRINITY_DN2558_c0_g1_i1:77-739(-)